MPFEEGIDMMITAQRVTIEERLFMRWVVSYQTQMTFDDFKEKMKESKKQAEDDRTEEQILKAVRSILGEQ